MGTISGTIDDSYVRIIDEMVNEDNQANPDRTASRAKLIGKVVSAWFNQSTDSTAKEHLQRLSAAHADPEKRIAILISECGRHAADSSRLLEEITAFLGDFEQHAAEIGRLRADIQVRDKVIARLEGDVAWHRAFVDRWPLPTVGTRTDDDDRQER